jgi:hypothetical protein
MDCNNCKYKAINVNTNVGHCYMFKDEPDMCAQFIPCGIPQPPKIELYCNFCSAGYEARDRVIADTGGGCICDKCVTICCDLLGLKLVQHDAIST